MMIRVSVLVFCVYFVRVEDQTNVTNPGGRRSAAGAAANSRTLDAAPTAINGVVERLGNNKIFAGLASNKSAPDPIHVASIFCNVGQKPSIKHNFQRMVASLVRHCPKCRIYFHLLTDLESYGQAADMISYEGLKHGVKLQVSPYYIENFAREYSGMIEVMQAYFTSKPGTYYSQALFFASVRMPDLVPPDVTRLIFIDVDTKFQDSITKLAAHFDDFEGEQMLGLTPELSPVYRHILYSYRNKHKKTLLGEPKGVGFPGFNSGVILMKLDRLRKSEIYYQLMTNSSLHNLTRNYEFKGHLGDQDFYTLVALEHPHLFHTLPCNWNRQLCQWWKSKGYIEIFDRYYECRGFISLYHGNCNSQIPEET